MRALLCSPVPVDPRLGAAKVYIEVASALRGVGWDVELVDPDEVGAPGRTPGYPLALREYLRRRADQFDVVEYEHEHLPFPRSDFPPSPLFVARSVLLVHHMVTTPIPIRPGLRPWVGKLLRGRRRRRQLAQLAADATNTCREADLVNVPNPDDRDELARHGIDSSKVVVLPFGLTVERLAALAAAWGAPPGPTVAFVGTVDPRKGMRDLPVIADHLASRVPGAGLRLLGTRGMLRTAAEVLALFPRRLRNRVEVIPAFDPSELPGLLAGCAAGVFPSIVEGFPFGVLEMLAAGLPVVAYRAPGAPAMLADEYLVPRGDAAAAGARLAALLTDRDRLTAARAEARTRSGDFTWDDIGRRTAAEYTRRLAARRHTAVV